MNDLFSSYGGIDIDDVTWEYLTTEANCQDGKINMSQFKRAMMKSI